MRTRTDECAPGNLAPTTPKRSTVGHENLPSNQSWFAWFYADGTTCGDRNHCGSCESSPAGSLRAAWSAKNTVCKNNLKQIGLALAAYTTTHEAYPPWRQWKEGYSNRMSLWFTLLDLPLNRVRTPRRTYYYDGVFKCPLNKGAQITDPEGGTYLDIAAVTYGYNGRRTRIRRGGAQSAHRSGRSIQPLH